MHVWDSASEDEESSDADDSDGWEYIQRIVPGWQLGAAVAFLNRGRDMERDSEPTEEEGVTAVCKYLGI